MENNILLMQFILVFTLIILPITMLLICFIKLEYTQTHKYKGNINIGCDYVIYEDENPFNTLIIELKVLDKKDGYVKYQRNDREYFNSMKESDLRYIIKCKKQ